VKYDAVIFDLFGTIRRQIEYDRDYGVDCVDAKEWRGPVIDSLEKILDLVV
jgi:hypothetical protein